MQPVELIDADVLIVGGGFAGAWAACRAAEIGAKVVLVEKAYVSRSGASAMSGGLTTCPLPQDDLDRWIEEFVVRGGYMCDQQWTRRLLEGQRDRVAQLAAWGVPIARDNSGHIRRFASRGMVAVRCMQYDPKRAMEALRERATSDGVRIIDRLCVTELMTSDGAYPTRGQVIGAFGFDVRSGACTAVRAPRTILATGQISLKGLHHVDNDTGDGVAMAWRVGARLIDLEFSFGGTFTTLMKRYNLGSYNVAVAQGARLINREGARFMARYDPMRFERSELSRVIAAFVKELRDGRGPVFLDLRHCAPSYWKDLEGMSMLSGGTALLSGRLPDPRVHPIPIEATWSFWSGGRGGVGIDLDCRTTVPGLYAAGATAKNAATGTHASAGSPTAFAMNSGYFAGESAAREALRSDVPALPAGLLARLGTQATVPLRRPVNGPSLPDRLHDELAGLGGPICDAIELNEDKLHRLMARARTLREAAESGGAGSVHELVKLHEARNAAQNAGLIYASAKDRTESREQFYRSDCPETDDEAWFCLHGVHRTARGEQFERIPIPLASYPISTRPHRPRQLSPIAAIFAGSYDPDDHD